MTNKIKYIELLRFIATIAVILIHVSATIPNNYSIVEVGIFNYASMYTSYVAVNWAVPIFLMITGALLLRDERNLNLQKIKTYITRMLLVLLTFGIFFSMIEICMNEKEISFSILLTAVINTASGKSWSHIWYIYLLIGIYIVTLPIKYAVNIMREKHELDLFIIILCIGNFVIPFFNTIFQLNIENFMQFSHYLTYFILGYRLSLITRENIYNFKLSNFALFVFLFISILKCVLSFNWIYMYKEICPFIQGGGKIFTLIQASSLFIFIKLFSDKINSKLTIINRINMCSFCIYIIHPVFINILYKIFKITPLIIQVNFGIFLMFIVVFLLSWISSEILIQLPVLRKIL